MDLFNRQAVAQLRRALYAEQQKVALRDQIIARLDSTIEAQKKFIPKVVALDTSGRIDNCFMPAIPAAVEEPKKHVSMNDNLRWPKPKPACRCGK